MVDQHYLQARVNDGMSVTEIARDADTSTASVYRAAKKHGVELPAPRTFSFATIRQTLDGMKQADAIEYLIELLKCLSPVEDEVEAKKWGLKGFTPQEARVLTVLKANAGIPVSNERILDFMYAQHRNVDHVADMKVIAVYVSKIRSKLRTLDEPFEIKTVRGFGYYMTEDQ